MSKPHKEFGRMTLYELRDCVQADGRTELGQCVQALIKFRTALKALSLRADVSSEARAYAKKVLRVGEFPGFTGPSANLCLRCQRVKYDTNMLCPSCNEERPLFDRITKLRRSRKDKKTGRCSECGTSVRLGSKMCLSCRKLNPSRNKPGKEITSITRAMALTGIAEKENKK